MERYFIKVLESSFSAGKKDDYAKSSRNKFDAKELKFWIIIRIFEMKLEEYTY